MELNKVNETRVVISIAEMKPHTAVALGLGMEAVVLGMKDVQLSADYDDKITYIHGTVDDVDGFEAAMKRGPLHEGTLSRVGVWCP